MSLSDGRPTEYDEPMVSLSVRVPERMKRLLKRAGGKRGASGAVRRLVEENEEELRRNANQ